MAGNKVRVNEVPGGLVIENGRLPRDVTTKVADIVISRVADVSGVEVCTRDRSVPTHHEIAELAYRLYELRGRQDGYHMEDWLRAERELVHHFA